MWSHPQEICWRQSPANWVWELRRGTPGAWYISYYLKIIKINIIIMKTVIHFFLPRLASLLKLFSSLYSSPWAWMSEFSDHKRKQFKTLRNKLHEKVEDGCWSLNLKSRQWMLDESLWSFHKQNGAGERKEVWNWIFPFIFYQLQSGSQCWPLLTNVGSYWTSLLLCSSWSFIEKADTREVLPR